MIDTESEQQQVAAAEDKMADETDTGGASSAAKTESDASAAAEAAEKKENGKGKEDNGSKEETKGNGVRKAAEADISSDDEPIPKRNTPKKKSRVYESSSSDEDEWKRYFASMCWECKHKAYSSKRCRKEKEHTDIDWRNDDRARTDQQERGVDGTSKTSSPLKSPSTLGGGAARRPQDRDASARRYSCYA